MCDRCGQRYPLKELKTETERGRENNLLVCPSCWDDEHPQEPDRYPIPDDRQSIDNPRPEIDEVNIRSMWSFNPAGNPEVYLSLQAGKAYVT